MKHWQALVLGFASMPGPVIASIALALVRLHGPNGREIDVNPMEIASLRAPLDIKSHWAEGVNCIVVMSSGRFNAVSETCDEVRELVGKP